MKLLVIDGNSILNRAFYGIKLLTTKDGHFTNGIYGFLNIYLRLKELCAPDAVAVAFDLRAPTFRHQMYGGYKAQRKGMPPELAEQLPILKELLSALASPWWNARATKQMISSARFPPSVGRATCATLPLATGIPCSLWENACTSCLLLQRWASLSQRSMTRRPSGRNTA